MATTSARSMVTGSLPSVLTLLPTCGYIVSMTETTQTTRRHYGRSDDDSLVVRAVEIAGEGRRWAIDDLDSDVLDVRTTYRTRSAALDVLNDMRSGW